MRNRSKRFIGYGVVISITVFTLCLIWSTPPKNTKRTFGPKVRKSAVNLIGDGVKKGIKDAVIDILPKKD